MTSPPPAIRGNPAHMRDTLRYFLDGWRCAKVAFGDDVLAISAHNGGIGVGELGSENWKMFSSLEAALREFKWNDIAVGDLFSRTDCKIEPPECENA